VDASGNVFSVAKNGVLTKHDALTGAEMWSVTQGTYSRALLVDAAGDVYFATDGSTQAIAKYRDGTATWTVENVGVPASLLLDGDTLYAAGHNAEPGDFSLAVISATSGQFRHLWSYDGGMGVPDSMMPSSRYATHLARSSDGAFYLAGNLGVGPKYKAQLMKVGPDIDADSDSLPDAWETAKFGSIAAHSYDSDEDGDGIDNLLEYALGLDPLIPNANASPAPTIEGGYLTLAVEKRPYVNLSIEGRSATPNGAWSTSRAFVLTNDATTLKARFISPIASTPSGFLRICVTGP
jgi:hypothetical protein